MNESKSDQIGTLIESLKFTPELGPPTLMEFLALMGIAAVLIYIGHLIKRVWARNNELVPIPVALMMALGMFAAYFVLVTMLYQQTTDNTRANLLMWSIFALALPAVYYGRIIVDAFATRVIDQVSPFSMRIEEPSEFAEARKLALRRDIDGAVKRYRAYLENTDAALFEAARLLKAEDRFAEAAALFQEIAERFYGKKTIWAEASYHLAKLRETNLHQPQEAMALLESILERTPDSRFGQLAEVELTRMQTLYGVGLAAREHLVDAPVSEDPFYESTSAPAAGAAAAGNGPGRKQEAHDDPPVPDVDPFYAATLRARAADEAEAESREKAQPDGDSEG